MSETVQTTSPYVDFVLYDQKKDTQVWAIYNKNNDAIIGVVKWCISWHQYVFEPEPKTGWSRKCLRDICELLAELMDTRKEVLGR